MTANQRKRPSRNNRAVQLTSEQLVEAKTLDLKAHHSFKNLMGLAAISVVVFVCLGSLIHKQRSVMNEWDLGEVIRGVDLKAGTLAKNNFFITNKGQFEASGVTVSLTGTKLKLQQHQDGKYYVCNSATGDCVLVSDVQAEKIRDQLQRGENIGYCHRQPKEPSYMSRQEAATQLFMSAPPASIDVVIEQLERDAQAAGIDIHTISVMASLLRDRIEAYSDVLKIEPERVIHALEVLRGTEVPWAFYTPSRLPELEDVHCWETPHDFDQDLGEHQLRRYICPKCEHESTDPMRCTAGHAPGVNQYPESCDATIWNSPDSWDSINPIIKLIIKSTFLADLTVHTIFYPKGLKLPEIQDVEQSASGSVI